MMDIYLFGVCAVALYIFFNVTYHFLNIRFEWSLKRLQDHENLKKRFDDIVEYFNGCRWISYLVAGIVAIMVWGFLIGFWPIVILWVVVGRNSNGF